jgi:hypothetical protein
MWFTPFGCDREGMEILVDGMLSWQSVSTIRHPGAHYSERSHSARHAVRLAKLRPQACRVLPVNVAPMSAAAAANVVRVVRTQGLCILRQLRLEVGTRRRRVVDGNPIFSFTRLLPHLPGQCGHLPHAKHLPLAHV